MRMLFSKLRRIVVSKMLPEGCEGKGAVSFLFVLLVGIMLGALGLYFFNGSIRQIVPGLPNQSMQAPGGSTGNEEHAGQPKSKKEGRKILYWVDPMNPSHKSDKPGKAPDGMDLVPVYADETGPESLPPGSVKINPKKQQLIGVQYGEVTSGPLTKTIRTVGRLAIDETRLARIQARIEGWIEKVFVDFPGKYVKKGDPLLSVYSPELVATQRELLVAKKAKESFGDNEFREIGANAQALYRSTLERLKLWNVSDQQVKEIEKSGKPVNALTFPSPISGFVIAKNALPGQRITPETELYSIADLSTIWVMADVYEYEVQLVKLGQTAVMDLSYFPGEKFRGKVTYIYPQLNPETRTLRVRLEFPNPDFRLKPDMYANIELKTNLGTQISVPDSAVLDAGTEQIVFVSREDGYFESRKVQLGARADNRYIVLSGLAPGEKIVTSGNFLIDSESKLKSTTGSTGGAHAGHGGGGPAGAEKKEGAIAPEAKSGTPEKAKPRQTTPPGGIQHENMPGMNMQAQPQSVPEQAPMPGMQMDHSQHEQKQP